MNLNFQQTTLFTWRSYNPKFEVSYFTRLYVDPHFGQFINVVLTKKIEKLILWFLFILENFKLECDCLLVNSIEILLVFL